MTEEELKQLLWRAYKCLQGFREADLTHGQRVERLVVISQIEAALRRPQPVEQPETAQA